MIRDKTVYIYFVFQFPYIVIVIALLGMCDAFVSVLADTMPIWGLKSSYFQLVCTVSWVRLISVFVTIAVKIFDEDGCLFGNFYI